MQPPAGKENHFITVLSLSAVLGMAVALAVYFTWRSGAIPGGFDNPAAILALIVCPPFILSIAAGPALDADLAIVLIAGTIVLANAFLYAGVAAGGYFVFTSLRRRRS